MEQKNANFSEGLYILEMTRDSQYQLEKHILVLSNWLDLMKFQQFELIKIQEKRNRFLFSK